MSADPPPRLGDRNNRCTAGLPTARDDVIHVLIEMRRRPITCFHHAQKILAIFAAMRDFAQLREAGHRHYVAIDNLQPADAARQPRTPLIAPMAPLPSNTRAPDEWRLDAQLADYAQRPADPGPDGGQRALLHHPTRPPSSSRAASSG